jgi:Uma2 family endonuclease
LRPLPGKATEKDVLHVLDHEDRICELVEGTLVEKVMGAKESALALELGKFLGIFNDAHDLGMFLGADGTLRLLPGLVRVPDISFVSWKQLPSREYPSEPIPDLFPDLAVEVLSRGNTRGEMRRKLKEYFLAGTRVVWFVDAEDRTVTVFTAPDQSTTLTEKDTLDGGKVLPGFRLALKQLFARIPGPRKTGTSRRKS